MCGLLSIFNLSKKSEPISKSFLNDGIRMVAHRGPDNYGFTVAEDKSYGLAHSRLSILDLETGQQPLSNRSKQVIAIVNGEFYDYQKIRASLEGKGYLFETNSDSELIIPLYEEYGADFVEHLRGEFAFILYDRRRKRIIAGRDRFGVKPLLYHVDHIKNRLYIASEAKSLFALGVESSWNVSGYMHARDFQYLPQNETLFRNVHQLEPGHLLIQEMDKELLIKKYWDINYPEKGNKSKISFEDAKNKTHDLLVEAIKVRLQSDVPLCTHLSGGIDSGAISGIVAAHSEKAIDCFTVRFEDFEDAGYDEGLIAKEQAHKIGAQLHEVKITAKDTLDCLSDAVYKSEGLAINGHISGKYLLNQAINKTGFKVALSGEGSDEIFAGYPHFRADMLFNENNLTGSSARDLFTSNNKLSGVFLAEGTELDTSAVKNSLDFVPAFMNAKASLGYRMQSVISPPANNSVDHYQRIVDGLHISEQLKNRCRIDQSSYIWIKYTLANYILKTLGDGCEMAHSVEGRVPFLDHKLVDFIKTLPLEYKIKKDASGRLIEKHILREAVKPYISDTLYNRQKHPFIAPPIALTPFVRSYIGDVLTDSAVQDIPFFDSRALSDWYTNFLSMNPKERILHEPVLFMLLTTIHAQKSFKLRG